MYVVSPCLRGRPRRRAKLGRRRELTPGTILYKNVPYTRARPEELCLFKVAGSTLSTQGMGSGCTRCPHAAIQRFRWFRLTSHVSHRLARALRLVSVASSASLLWPADTWRNEGDEGQLGARTRRPCTPACPRHVLWSGKTGQTSSSRPADSQVRVCTSLLDKRLERLSSQTCRLPAFEKVNGHHMVIFNPGTQQHVLSAGIYQRAGCAKGSGRRPCRSSPPPRIAVF